MSNTALFVELGAIAMLFAGLPLAYVWMKREYGFFEKLNWLLVFMTFDLIVFGAFTRLSDSGLGCPDWPGCYGTSNPWHALGDIQEANAAFPTGPVSLAKAWIEMIHRYLAMTVGTLIVVQLLVAWSKVKSLGTKPLFGSLGLLLLVCVQGAFGAWTVTLKLQPIIVSTHLLLAIILLGCLTAYANQACLHKTAVSINSIRLPGKLLALAFVVLGMQIFLGAWVSTNYAVLACPDFPTCLGTFWPETQWQEGFTLWRQLGLTARGEFISPAALQTIHWAHRLFAVLVLIVLTTLFFITRNLPESKPLSKLLLVLLTLQVLTGISNVVFQWPLLAALMHTGGAAALVFCLVRMTYWASWKSPIQLR
jgi:heme a synthase